MKPTLLTALMLVVTVSAGALSSAATPPCCSVPASSQRQDGKPLPACCRAGSALRDVALGAVADPQAFASSRGASGPGSRGLGAEADATDGVVLRIEGMDCQGCVAAVETALSKLDGVSDVGVELESKLGWVLFGSPGAVTTEQLIKAVTDVGFKASVREGAAIAIDEDGNKRVIGPASKGGVPTPPGESDGTASGTKLISLDDSLDPLKLQFNAAKDQPRIVALLSPTCGGCLHAARALEKEALRAFPDDDFTLFVVWEPMLSSDNRRAAGESAAILDDPRAVQFWDETRQSGVSYARDVYPTYIGDIARSLGDDHLLADHFRGMESVPGERAPMWDFAAFYPAGVEWKEAPPLATSFIRQLAIFKRPDGTTSATLYTDDFTKGPVESDWFDEVRSRMPRFLAKTSPK